MEKAEMKEGTDNILFFHGETCEHGPKDCKFTIAGIVRENSISLAISICSLNDQFVKAEGRKRATERLIKDTYGVIGIAGNTKKGSERKTFNRISSTFTWMSKNELVNLFNIQKGKQFKQEIWCNGITAVC